MGRREIRENIFKLLFRIEFNTKEEMPQQVKLYFEDENAASIGEKEQMEIENKYEDIAARIVEIDEKINAVADKWNTSRIGKVELTILRLACYEIVFDEDIPTQVAINEAVEIAKKFGGDDSPAFVNGILGKFVKEQA